MNPVVGALEANADRMIELIRQSANLRADIVAFPELSITGYPPEDLVLKPEFVRDNQRELERVASTVREMTAIVGFVDSDGTDIFNAAAIIQEGKVVGVHRKFFLPNYSVFDEQRYFAAGTGWAIYRIRGVDVGVTICEDIWYPIGPGTLQAMAGAEVIMNINASPYRAGKHEQSRNMVATRALDELSYVCYLNAVGGQDELVFEGASIVADPEGRVVAQGAFFEEDFLVVDLDIDKVFSARLHYTRRRQNSLPPGVEVADSGELVETPLAWNMDDATRTPVPPIIREIPSRLAEIYGALVLGSRDYVRKNAFGHVFIGL